MADRDRDPLPRRERARAPRADLVRPLPPADRPPGGEPPPPPAPSPWSPTAILAPQQGPAPALDDEHAHEARLARGRDSQAEEAAKPREDAGRRPAGAGADR